MFNLATGAIMTSPVSVVDLKAEIDKLASEYMSSAAAGALRKKLALLDRSRKPMASARSLVMTRCSLPCRPMRWYGLTMVSTILLLISKSLHPSFSVLGSVWGLGDAWILP